MARDPAAAHLRRLLDARRSRGPGKLSPRQAALAAALLWLAGGIAPASAQARREAVATGLIPRIRVEGRERRFTIEERLAHYRVPGAAVAVVLDGRLDWSGGWGVRSARGREPVEASTLFQVGGLSQTVTALAVLRLASEGALDLDAPVNQALRTWKLPVNALSAASPVTVRLLLRHEAGIGAGALVGYGPAESLPLLHDVLEGSALAGTPPVRVEAAPGSGYAPSPGGYAILQKLVEDVGRRPFARFAGEEVLAPLALGDSGYGPLSRERELPAALGHDAAGDAVRGGYSRYPVDAASGLWSSARDLGALLVAIQSALAGSAAAPLRAAAAREMLGAGASDGVGMGWRLEGEGAAAYARQSGATDGYRAEMVSWVDGGRAAVVLTNGDAGDELAREVLAGIASVYGWPGLVPRTRRVAALDEAQLARLVGRYELGPHRVLEVRVQGAGLRLLQAGSAAVTLVPESATFFFSDEPPLEAEFVLDATGAVLGVELAVDGSRLPARRLP